MLKLAAVILGLVAMTPAIAAPPAEIDLRTPHALAILKRDNPAHYEKIRQILAGLEEKPERVEADWLQATFDARDVDLTRMIVKTSYPPKQVLNFRLDQVRYTMYVVRRDMVAEIQPLH